MTHVFPGLRLLAGVVEDLNDHKRIQDDLNNPAHDELEGLHLNSNSHYICQKIYELEDIARQIERHQHSTQSFGALLLDVSDDLRSYQDTLN